MLSCKERIGLTISSIEYSDEIEDNWELFHKGIDILKMHNCNEELEDCEREVLEEIFSIMS
jgi:hypothetical protein